MNHSFVPLETVGGLHCGPLCPYVEPYVALVAQQGYKPKGVLAQVRLIAALNCLLVRTRRDARDVEPELTARFLRRRLRGREACGGEWSTLDRLTALLRQSGVTARKGSARPHRPNARVVDTFREYLRKERGLSLHTVTAYARWADRFLSWRFAADRVCVRRLTGRDLTAFIQHRATQTSQAELCHLVAALRALGRFLHYSGRVARDLSTAIPAVARWSLADVPAHLSAKTVERVLARCGRSTPCGRRNYAILLLLARLGLRGGEVLRLELEDIDWEAGRIAIRSGKNGQAARLPLPADAGAAITEYLRRDRPRCASRRVFLRVNAPHAGLSASPVISMVVGKALDRAGVSAVRKGAHVFRHSLATTMLGRGTSLPEIGQILRHRSPKSTAIYAKVDLETLRTIALPWPGGAT
jgi:site-specific recombinase XerD